MSHWSEAYKKKVIQKKLLKARVEKIKGQGLSIATLNGSFDLLHAGHLEILYQASKLADVLIVALNSDDSIRQYKSKNRPIIPLTFRLQMMAAIEFVTYVTWFEETNPIEILSIIQPDFHINGSEYGESCIEAETVKKLGGKIKIIPLIDGLSTSDIIRRIQCA